ncbi:MAG: hypothetical protein ISR44_05175 [Rhodospirillales bacterium]|nr:hypothetical protein [Rhodospirillales bacterium]
MGRSRFANVWAPFCPICFNRALGTGPDVAIQREKAKYTLGVLIGPGLLVASSIFFYVMIDRVLIQYVPALTAFYGLALACGLVLSAYGVWSGWSVGTAYSTGTRCREMPR